MAAHESSRPRPLFPYYGSKFKMAPFLEGLVPPTTKVMYSMFVGSGAFEYYYAHRHPECRVICYDSDPRVINMHRWAQLEPRLLYNAIKRKVMAMADADGCITKAQYKGLTTVIARNETNLLGAVCFFILASSSFSGKYGTYARHRIIQPKELLRPRPRNMTFAVADTLKKLPKLHASKDSFIYLDPPYFINDQVYYRHYKFDHEGLATTLHKCRLRWLLSYNDIRAVRSLYKGAPTKTWRASTNVIVGGENVIKSRSELLLSNHPIRKVQ
jgi:site-specific DNA-adenine methylase